ncbi:SDR family oxidoreductase [Caenimonas terrae]|uniref:SDR family oxidoreductase n=1 Tax=Caenimonas terrae TaxID=696074 RepID=A0ABW0NLC2_9BURK
MNPPQPPRTVLVTGAARRLGREVALALAAGGWQVAVHYRGSAGEAQQTVADCAAAAPAGAAFQAFQADLQDEAAVRALLPRVVERFGAVDAVVNNASLFEHDGVASFGYDALAAHLRTNAGAPILLAQALYAHLKSRNGSGAVVNMLDQKLWNQNPDFLSYTLSKAALEAATTMLAMALAPQLRVVGVAPGLTLTSHLLAQEKFQQLHKLSPLGRSSTPQDVVAAVKFALENASITGTTLLVDGGQHLMKFERDFSLMP